MKISEEAIRRQSRTLLLRDVGGRGLEAILAARARFEGGGAVLDAARLFATRAGLGLADVPPFDLTVVADETGELARSLSVDVNAPLVLAACGASGVAVVAASTVVAAPCAACAFAAARLAAGAPSAAKPGALALAAGARAAGLALALAMGRLELRAGSPRSITLFPDTEPFPAALPLRARPGCECAETRA